MARAGSLRLHEDRGLLIDPSISGAIVGSGDSIVAQRQLCCGAVSALGNRATNLRVLKNALSMTIGTSSP